MRVEHEYARGGALAYLAAWDVRRGGVIGRCEATTGIAPFSRLVDQVMAQEPYRSAPASSGSWTAAAIAATPPPRGSRGGTDPRAGASADPRLLTWPGRLYFSIVQRKVLTPNDFPDLAAVERRLLEFAALYNDTAVPFRWRFTRRALEDRLAALPDLPPPAATGPPERAAA
jgi:hypothetical protein